MLVMHRKTSIIVFHVAVAILGWIDLGRCPRRVEEGIGMPEEGGDDDPDPHDISDGTGACIPQRVWEQMRAQADADDSDTDMPTRDSYTIHSTRRSVVCKPFRRYLRRTPPSLGKLTTG